MAYLILNEREPYADETGELEKYYEFDPNDKAAINRIHQILALRNRGIAIKSDKLLSDICEHTLDTAIKAKKAFISKLFELARKHFPYLKRSKSKTPKSPIKNLNSYTCHLCGAPISCFRG